MAYNEQWTDTGWQVCAYCDNVRKFSQRCRVRAVTNDNGTTFADVYVDLSAYNSGSYWGYAIRGRYASGSIQLKGTESSWATDKTVSWGGQGLGGVASGTSYITWGTESDYGSPDIRGLTFSYPVSPTTWGSPVWIGLNSTMTTGQPEINATWARYSNSTYCQFQLRGTMNGAIIFNRGYNRNVLSSKFTLDKHELARLFDALGESTTGTLSVSIIGRYLGNGYGTASNSINVTVTKNSTKLLPLQADMHTKNSSVSADPIRVLPYTNLDLYEYAEPITLKNYNDLAWPAIPDNYSYDFIFEEVSVGVKEYNPKHCAFSTEWGLPYDKGIRVLKSGWYTVAAQLYISNNNSRGILEIIRWNSSGALIDSKLANFGYPADIYTGVTTNLTMYVSAGEALSMRWSNANNITGRLHNSLGTHFTIFPLSYSENLIVGG